MHSASEVPRHREGGSPVRPPRLRPGCDRTSGRATYRRWSCRRSAATSRPVQTCWRRSRTACMAGRSVESCVRRPEATGTPRSPRPLRSRMDTLTSGQSDYTAATYNIYCASAAPGFWDVGQATTRSPLTVNLSIADATGVQRWRLISQAPKKLDR